MTLREKVLASAIAALLGVWVLWSGVGWYFGLVDRLEQQLRQAESNTLDAEDELGRMKRSLTKLERYQAQSLPADPDVARSSYSAWLVDAVARAGLELDDVQFSNARSRPGAYTALAFNVEAEGSLESFVRFMDEYHRRDCLHQLAKLQLTPGDEEGDMVRVSLTSVALVVNGTTREEGVPPVMEQGDSRLRLAVADDYVQNIGSRNLFARYTPPPPPRPPAPKREPRPEPPGPPPFDHAEHAYLTGVVETGGDLQAWIYVRTTGEVLRLKSGDSLSVGLLEGTVQSVLPRSIVLQSDGQEWSTPLGSPLKSG